MKKIMYLLAFGLLAMFAACSDDDDDNKSDQTINVGGKDYVVYQVVAEYSQVRENLTIGLMLQPIGATNDIFFMTDHFDLNSLESGKIYSVVDLNENFGTLEDMPQDTFSAYINDLHDNTAPVYSKEGKLTVLEYDEKSKTITMEFNVTFTDVDYTYEKTLQGTLSFGYEIIDIQE